jgi:NTP pyrophosphatase (non-canonical NTP hydrolase)
MSQYNRLNEISIEIGTWASKNFAIHAPKLGVLEEVGEMVHCVLKRFQKIRGYDKPDYFKSQFRDAIADCAIYLMHHMNMEDIKLESTTTITDVFNTLDQNLCDPDEATDFFGTMMEDVTSLLQDVELSLPTVTVVESIIACLAYASMQEGFDFMDAVEETWARVMKRDWVKNPTDADKHAEQIHPAVPAGNEAP